MQDYSDLVGYPRVVYAPGRQSATITALIFRKDPAATVTYETNLAPAQSSPIFVVSAAAVPATEITVTVRMTLTSGRTVSLVRVCYVCDARVRIVVYWLTQLIYDDFLAHAGSGIDGFGQVMEPVHLWWSNLPIVQGPQYLSGQKGAIVELFGWPYADVAKECVMLSKAGYMGVKVYPPNESILSFEWLQQGELNPWWYLYQPVSYKLYSRMGDRAALRDMIDTCRSHGVRVYVRCV